MVTQYTYDANNNISTITSNGQTIAYTYNSLDELVREDNQVLNKTIVYSYDAGGNILSKTEYPYTTSQTLGTPTNTITYAYDSVWKDKLTSYNGNAITYDAAGNTLTYNGYSFTWEGGRQLAAVSGNGQNISYKYNNSGYRTEKTINGITTKYYLDGDKVILENTGTDSIYYSYDADGKLISMTLNGTEYFYLRNGQGDITGLIDTVGTQFVSYIYDSWGKLVSIDGSLKDTVGLQNLYRYRGYRYDTETGLYYLQSRYYNPEIGRYISTDEPNFLGMTGTILSYNLYSYCENNPVNLSDQYGYLPNWIVKLLRDSVMAIINTALFNQLIIIPTIITPPLWRISLAISNYIHNSKLEKKNPITAYIDDQSDYKNWRLGLYSLKNCGCELIAVYNVLRMLNKTVPLAFLALEFELCGYVMAYGYLGSSPTALWRCFAIHRLKFTTTYRLDTLKKYAQTSKAIIMSYWWSPVKLHTIAIQRTYQSYKAYNNGGSSYPKYNLDVFMDGGKFIIGYCF